MSEVKKSDFWVVNEVSRILNLGEFGKMEHFMGGTVKFLTREIAVAKRSIDNAKFNLESKVDLLEEKIKDAEEALVDSYTSIPQDKIKSNADQVKFRETYLANIDTADSLVMGLKEELAEEKEKTAKIIKDAEAEIAVRKVRIKMLKSGK